MSTRLTFRPNIYKAGDVIKVDGLENSTLNGTYLVKSSIQDSVIVIPARWYHRLFQFFSRWLWKFRFWFWLR